MWTRPQFSSNKLLEWRRRQAIREEEQQDREQQRHRHFREIIDETQDPFGPWTESSRQKRNQVDSREELDRRKTIFIRPKRPRTLPKQTPAEEWLISDPADPPDQGPSSSQPFRDDGDSNKDDEFVYVRVRKSELHVDSSAGATGAAETPVSTTFRPTTNSIGSILFNSPSGVDGSHTLNSKVGTTEALLSLQDPTTNFSPIVPSKSKSENVHQPNREYDFSPVFQDLGCGLGPFRTPARQLPSFPPPIQSPPPSSSQRVIEVSPPELGVIDTRASSEDHVDRDLSDLQNRVAELRERRRRQRQQHRRRQQRQPRLHVTEKPPERQTAKTTMITKPLDEINGTSRRQGTTATTRSNISSSSRNELSLEARVNKLEADIREYKMSTSSSSPSQPQTLPGWRLEDRVVNEARDEEDDPSLHHRIDRLERELIAVKSQSTASKGYGRPDRGHPPPSHASNDMRPASHISQAREPPSRATSLSVDHGLERDFDRMMHLDSYHHREDYHHDRVAAYERDPHNDTRDNDYADNDDYEDPANQLKDSLARARETFHDKEVLQSETSRSIRNARRKVHANSAYKEELLFDHELREVEDEYGCSRGGVGVSTEKRLEDWMTPHPGYREGSRSRGYRRGGSNSPVFTVATTTSAANARPVYWVQEMAPQITPESRLSSKTLVVPPKEVRATRNPIKTKSPSRVRGPNRIDPPTRTTSPPTGGRRIVVPDRYWVMDPHHEVE